MKRSALLKPKYQLAAFSRQIVFIALLQLNSLSSSAQTPHFEWEKSIGGAGSNTEGVKIIVDSNKAVITAGGFDKTVDIDGGTGTFNLTSHGGVDVFITKYDTGGVFMWAKQIGGSLDDQAKDIKFDKNGDLILLGGFPGTVDLDPGPSVANFTAAAGVSYVIKLDHDGNFIWAKQLLLRDVDNVDIDDSNNIILSGSFTGTKDFDPGPGTFSATAGLAYEDLFIQKLDNNGNFIWMRQMPNLGTSTHQHFGLETDGDNSIYFAGSFTSTIDFDPGPGVTSVSSVGAMDAFVMKLDRQGTFQWVKHWGAGHDDKVFGLEVDKEGNVYTTGEFRDTVDLDPGPSTYTASSSPGIRSCFISKFDKQGNLIFAKSLQGDSFGQSIHIDSSKNIYVSGGFHDTVDFDPGASVYNVPKGVLFTMKLSSNGNFAWAAGYLSNDYYESIYSAIAIDIFKNVYFTGLFADTTDFDPGPSSYSAIPAGKVDAYIHKISQCHSVTNLSTSFCSSYTHNNVTYNNSGTYYQVFPVSNNCDSILVLNLIRMGKHTSSAASACKAYTWNGTVFTNSGIYRDTFALSNGCDSIVQLNLTIQQSPLTIINATACGNYLWNQTLLTQTGIYKDTITVQNGCDSIVQLSLTIHPLPRPALGSDTTLCMNTTLVVTPGNFNSYLWNNAGTADSLAITAPGNYWVAVTDNNNCVATDSIRVSPGVRCEECALTSETKFYPVPCRNQLTVYKNSTKCEVRLNLYNTLGQLVMKERLIADGLNEINLATFAAGNYYYVLYGNGNILRKGNIMKQ